MSISKKDVEHIANLARIELTAAEKEKFAGELTAILDFVEKLNEVDTSNVLPLAGGIDLPNVLRPDEELDKSLESKQAEMLIQAPDKKGEWVRVKAVFE